MSEKTKIAWCDSTVNFWSGCTKVSAGCLHCYAEAQSNRFLIRNTNGELLEPKRWGKGQPRKLHESAFKLAHKLNRKLWVCDECGSDKMLMGSDGRIDCAKCGSNEVHRRRTFSLSLGDWLDPEVPIEWLARMLDTIRMCDQVTWILCTKRPESWWPRTTEVLTTLFPLCSDAWNWLAEWQRGNATPPNVWILTSVENQEMADKRIPELLRIPAALRGLSCEPLLERVVIPFPCDFSENTPRLTKGGGLDWIIVGGESGRNARPCKVEWIRSLKDQAQAAGVACFVKQLGSNPIDDRENITLNLAHKAGADLAEWPEDLRVQQFPGGQTA